MLANPWKEESLEHHITTKNFANRATACEYEVDQNCI